MEILCKIRFDGSHYVGSPYSSKLNPLDVICSSKEDLGLDEKQKKKSLFINLYSNEKHIKFIKNINYSGLNNYLRYLYLSSMEFHEKSKTECKEFVYLTALENIDMLYEKYLIRNKSDLFIIIDKFFENFDLNLETRRLRFKRKAYNNDWNYFATFTYDDSKHDENTFVKTLKKKLSNYSTRYGWKYIIIPERSPLGRLHFHGLLFVPKMIGNLVESEYYSLSSKKMVKAYLNSEFGDKIGRTDFKFIPQKETAEFQKEVSYICKYMGKSNQSAIYSRGLKCENYVILDADKLLCKIKGTEYHVLSDLEDSISVDYKILNQ